MSDLTAPFVFNFFSINSTPWLYCQKRLDEPIIYVWLFSDDRNSAKIKPFLYTKRPSQNQNKWEMSQMRIECAYISLSHIKMPFLRFFGLFRFHSGHKGVVLDHFIGSDAQMFETIMYKFKLWVIFIFAPLKLF